MIINTRLPDPKFKGQTKTMLASPTPKVEIPENTLRPVMKWQLVERLYAALEAKMFKTLSKTDGKKRRHIKLEKGVDANEAGGSRSMDCTLMIVEGKSASGYAETLISCIPNGRDLFGICPIKGKLINARKADFEQIMKNEEITQIKKMMGFREGIDYRLDENLRTLRYRFGQQQKKKGMENMGLNIQGCFRRCVPAEKEIKNGKGAGGREDSRG